MQNPPTRNLHFQSDSAHPIYIPTFASPEKSLDPRAQRRRHCTSALYNRGGKKQADSIVQEELRGGPGSELLLQRHRAEKTRREQKPDEIKSRAAARIATAQEVRQRVHCARHAGWLGGAILLGARALPPWPLSTRGRRRATKFPDYFSEPGFLFLPLSLSLAEFVGVEFYLGGRAQYCRELRSSFGSTAPRTCVLKWKIISNGEGVVCCLNFRPVIRVLGLSFQLFGRISAENSWDQKKKALRNCLRYFY